MFRCIGRSQSPKPYVQGFKIHAKEIPKEIITYICTFLSAPELASIAGHLNRSWQQLSSEDFLWKRLLKQELEGTNIYYITINKTLPRARPKALLAAAKNACKWSENGTATILTIPEGWSLAQLLQVEATINRGKNKQIKLSIDLYPESVTRTKLNGIVKQEQTIVLTNAAIRDSVGVRPWKEKSFLHARGFDKNIPDALIILTLCVATRIFYQVTINAFERRENINLTHARCAQVRRIFEDPHSHGVRVNKTDGSIIFKSCGGFAIVGFAGQKAFFKHKNLQFAELDL